MMRKYKKIDTQEKTSRRLLNLSSAAAYLGVSYWLLRAMLYNGEIPFIRIGRRILVDHQDLDDWIEKVKQREEAC